MYTTRMTIFYRAGICRSTFLRERRADRGYAMWAVWNRDYCTVEKTSFDSRA